MGAWCGVGHRPEAGRESKEGVGDEEQGGMERFLMYGVDVSIMW